MREMPRQCPSSAIRKGSLSPKLDPHANSSLLFRRAMEMIDKDPARLDVTSLARALGVSRSLLARTFKLEGRSVGKEIKKARYEKVFEFLRNPNQAIGPIANFCGWRSETTLMLNFKKRTGMSMREWRQRHLKGERLSYT